MPNVGTWRAPLPLRLGGKGHQRISDMMAVVEANRGSLLQGDENRFIEAENRMIARMLATGLRAVGRRVAQRDPASLSEYQRPVTLPGESEPQQLSPLERWERVLGLGWLSLRSPQARRAIVKARFLSQTANTLQVVTDTMAALLGSWFVEVTSRSVNDIDYDGRPTPGESHAFWGELGFTFSAQYPGAYRETQPWYSALAFVTVVVRPTATARRAEIDQKVGEAQRILGDLLPAWAVGVLSVLDPEQESAGFYADVSLVDYTAL